MQRLKPRYCQFVKPWNKEKCGLPVLIERVGRGGFTCIEHRFYENMADQNKKMRTI